MGFRMLFEPISNAEPMFPYNQAVWGIFPDHIPVVMALFFCPAAVLVPPIYEPLFTL